MKTNDSDINLATLREQSRPLLSHEALRCRCTPNQMMFTPGKVYPVRLGEGRTLELTDDLGSVRVLSDRAPWRFVCGQEPDHYGMGRALFAHFDRVAEWRAGR